MVITCLISITHKRWFKNTSTTYKIYKTMLIHWEAVKVRPTCFGRATEARGVGWESTWPLDTLATQSGPSKDWCQLYLTAITSHDLFNSDMTVDILEVNCNLNIPWLFCLVYRWATWCLGRKDLPCQTITRNCEKNNSSDHFYINAVMY